MNETILAKEEKIIVVDIKLTRGLILALSVALTVVAAGLYLALTGGSAQAAPQAAPVAAPGGASDGMRQFYLTPSGRLGGTATGGCATGYHMASIWEIADPSNLKYNTALGLAMPDSGSGPPSNRNGWVRTGYGNDTSTVIGQANCDGWDSSSSDHNGTVANLPQEWTAGWEDLNVWSMIVLSCGGSRRVWCIED